MNKKIVYSFTKFTTTDYQDEISCIVWHISCNLLCSYCYNDNIVFSKQGYYSHNDILDFLKSRVGLLSAVVLSGGEATMHNLEPFCKEVKKLGFKIKLDDSPEDAFGLSLYEIISEKTKEYNYPICFDFPVGHQVNNFAIKCGVKHRLSVSENEVIFKEI